MLQIAFMLALSLRSVAIPPTHVCGDRDAETPSMRSPSGYVVTLAMHSEDDHGKNTPLCQADYNLKVTDPDGTASAAHNFISTDDQWRRPIKFRIEGFSPDGNRVFLLVSEGAYADFVQASEYDLGAGIFKSVFLARHFTGRLSPARATSLRIAGVSSEGRMILISSAGAGCSRAEKWQLSPNRRTAKGSVIPEPPVPLSDKAEILPLAPGTKIEHP